MIINKLELTNFRRHRKLEVDLKPGVTGVVGGNGTGKSTIVEALQFALTGELYQGKKTDAITIGEDFGSVRMTFTLNGKKGTLTRYLSQGNLQLSYGEGGPKKKAGDVKELWESLLQIGPEIISKVIIAKQGDIPLLFSGSPIIREKIFQKIFLVPNTEKVRNAIQTNYLKQLPPLLYVEDPADLQAQIASLKEQIKQYNDELASLQCLDAGTLEEYKERIKFITKCQADVGTSIILHKGITDNTIKQTEIEANISELMELLKSIKIEDYETQRTTLLQQKALYSQKLKLEEELSNLTKVTIDLNEYEEAKKDFEQLTAKHDEARDIVTKTTVTLENLEQRLKKYQSITSQTVCDTCGQPLHSVIALIEALNLEKVEAQEEAKKAKVAYHELRQELVAQKQYLEEVSALLSEKARIEKSLAQFKTLTFNANALEMCLQVIEHHKLYKEELNTYQTELAKVVNSMAIQRQELKSLSFYDRTDITPEKEKEDLALLLAAHEQAFRQGQIIEVNLKMKAMEIDNLELRGKQSKENVEKNNKRKRYAELLGIALDTLSVRQFPRKLILNYADVVTDYLQEKLQGFNIPYTAKVGDDFQIEMYDDQGRKLPTVSGGQEIQVGISLHLALHELFSQSFPLLVIDEGTTHLDKANRRAYFDIIKKLKANDKLQQIIIIDHDPMLSEVVDNVIALDEND